MPSVPGEEHQQRKLSSHPRAKFVVCLASKGKGKNAEPSLILWAAPAGV